MKILLTLLTTHHIDKLERLVNNVINLNPVKDVELYPVIVVNTLKDSYYQEVLRKHFPYPVIRTESNGRAGKGKNSCAELFLNSDCDFLSQIDGDDLLYPTYLESLWNHISHYPSLDVLGVIPCDFVKRRPNGAGHQFKVKDKYHGSLWGVSLCYPDWRTPGPGVGDWINHTLPKSADFIILQSKKSAKYKIDENLPVGEDHLYGMKLLSLHQKGELQYFQTMSSDLYCIDATTEGSLQKQYSQADHVQEMKTKALEYLKRERSSFNELPVIYKDLLMSHIEKEKWILSNF